MNESTRFGEDDGARPKTVDGLQISSSEFWTSIDCVIKRTVQFDMVKRHALGNSDFFESADLLEKQ